MRKFLILLFLSCFTLIHAQDTTLVSKNAIESPEEISEQINQAFRPVADFIGSIVFYSFTLTDRTDYLEETFYDEYYKSVADSTAFADYNTKIGGVIPPKKMIDEQKVESSPAVYQYDTTYTVLNPEGYIDTIDAATYATLTGAEGLAMAVDTTLVQPAQYETKSVFLVQISEEEYNKTPSEYTVKKLAKNVADDEPPYEFIINKANKTGYTVKYIDANTYALSYTFDETDEVDGVPTTVSTYEVTKTAKFGEEQTFGDVKLTVNNKSADANTAVYTLSLSPVDVPFVLVILLLGALFATLYFGFPNIRYLRLSVNTIRGKYEAEDHIPQEDNPDTIRDESVDGEVTHFQALTAALSATVGLGNIAGVAVALSIGGPGATFWMIIAGLLGMSSKFVECTLGVKYREVAPDGSIYGGPMHYLSKGFQEKGIGWFGKILAIFFAIMCVGGSFGGGNMFQANQAAEQFNAAMGINNPNAGFYFGLVVMSIVALVIIGGIKRIGKVTEKVVPLMAAMYVGTALIIIFSNISAVPSAFGLIFEKAFSSEAATGGIIGVLLNGFKRAAFSNEAGVGSAAIAHSAVKTRYPGSEGVVALFEPFVDTVVICTMTALVLIITNINYGFMEYGQAIEGGVEITSIAFESSIPGATYILTVAVILFAVSTMLSWSYYGLQAWKYLFGKGKAADLIYKIVFCIFGVIGASVSLGAVIDFSDAMIFAMVFPNIIGIFFLANVVKKEINKYRAHAKEIDQAS